MSHIELVCNPDPRSPLNGGLMLLKPSAAVYAEGVRALQTTRFDPVAGWGDDARGAPRRCVRTASARLRPSARRPPSRAARRAPPRLAASSLRRTATGAPTVLGHLRARGPATRSSCSTCTLRAGCAGRTAASRTNRPACACCAAALVGGLQAEFRERLQYARGSKRWLGWRPKKNDGENSLHLAQFYDYVVRAASRATRHRRRPRGRRGRVDLQRRLRREIEAYSRFPQICGLGDAPMGGRVCALAGASRHPESCIYR